MLKFSRTTIVVTVVISFLVGFILATRFIAPQHDENKQQLPSLDQPKNDLAYVWAIPDQGYQSMYVISIENEQYVNAAFLVPVRIKLKANTLDKESLVKAISGQLFTMKLFGHTKDGLIVDVWIPAGKDDQTGKWLSGSTD